MTLLIVLVVVLGVMAVAQLARVYELTAKLRGKREEDITDSDNRMNARLMWLFCVAYFGFFIWLLVRYNDRMLPVSASEHGVWTDQLLDVNWYILFIVFFITNILLFYFAGRYVYDRNRRALWQPHNNKLELLWTIVPAVVLIGIIIYGLTIWNRITSPASPDAMVVEVYAKQFDWTARYPGADGIMGATDYRLINDQNPLGIVTPASIATRLDELAAEREAILKDIAQNEQVMPPAKLAESRKRVERIERTSARIIRLRTEMEQDIAMNKETSPYAHGEDDIVVKEFHLPIRKEVKMLIRSRDVIHSAYIPHLRAQMNAVPGMTTTFNMVPTITTDSMRTVMNDPAFEFILLCNKICGASHYNMQMALVVEPENAYNDWLAQQKPFQAAPEPAAPSAMTTTATEAPVTTN